jgi:exodeoxyribonuclease VII small subunit
MSEQKVNLKESLAKLNGIVEWFDEQEEVDVEVGLVKVKEGAELIKVCKKRLAEVENEFKEIQREIENN